MSTKTERVISYSTEAMLIWDYLLRHYDMPITFNPPILVDWTTEGSLETCEELKDDYDTNAYIAQARFNATWSVLDDVKIIGATKHGVNITHKARMMVLDTNYRGKMCMDLATWDLWHMLIHEFLHYIDAIRLYIDIYETGKIAKYNTAYEAIIHHVTHNVGQPEDEIETERRAIVIFQDLVLAVLNGARPSGEFDYMIPRYNSYYAKKNPRLNMALALVELYELEHKTTYRVNTFSQQELDNNNMAWRKLLKDISKMAEKKNETVKWVD